MFYKLLNFEFQHPKNVGMTYVQHFKLSFTCFIILFIASMKALVHCVYPDVFAKSTTKAVEKLHKIIEKAQKQHR